MVKLHFLQSFLHFLLKDLDIGGKFYSKYLGKSILLIAVFYCEPKFLPALCSIFWEEDRAKQYRKQGKARGEQQEGEQEKVEAKRPQKKEVGGSSLAGHIPE